MSCDSTTASSGISRAAFGPAPNLAWVWRLPLTLLNAITRRREYNELLELDDRLLADVGLSRPIVAAARKSPIADWGPLADCSFSLNQTRRASPCESNASAHLRS
ncbi:MULTISPECIES: DUF1127 domain-containing protein [Bradyrhizobium]|uniref:DUF1127 domain-containing protein n=1 Tax=Bradyrhizobium TaxID=374 RepID=UPI002169C0BB|nr:DUF1127 domain-containing protein [Bradyrhizobium centrosematis]